MRSWFAGALCLACLAASASAATRRACADRPAQVTPLSAKARALYQRVAAHLGARPPVGASPVTNDFCLTRTAIYLNSADVADAATAGSPAQAVASARLAYALGAWLARSAKSPSLELDAARSAGCALGRLGVRGDALTTQVLELRDWSGPHPQARPWMAAVMEGHAQCAQ